MDNDTRYRLEVVAPVFPVINIRRSLKYYTEALAFDVSFEWSDSENEPVRYAILRSGNTELHLSEAEGVHRAVAYFFVDSVAAYYETIKKKGAEITRGIEDFPWDMREFEVSDPDGNRIVFGEHLSRIEDDSDSEGGGVS